MSDVPFNWPEEAVAAAQRTALDAKVFVGDLLMADILAAAADAIAEDGDRLVLLSEVVAMLDESAHLAWQQGDRQVVRACRIAAASIEREFGGKR